MAIRLEHLRLEPLCRMCLSEGVVTACLGLGLRGQVDHVDGNDANNDASNLQTLCVTCHGRKTAQQAGGKLRLKASW